MLLLLISIVGFVGAIVRKLTLATTYAVGLYIHFLINVIAATYILSVILHTTHTDADTVCQTLLKNQQSKDECNSIFDATRGLYAGTASFVLIVELYAAILATRYVYQLRGEKREARMPSHMRPQSDSRRLMPGIVRYTDASGATVYSSHSYQPIKDHAREASGYSLTTSDFEVGLDDLLSAKPHDTVNLEALSSEDEYREDNNYRDREHEDRHPPRLHEAGLSRTSSRTGDYEHVPMMAHNRNAPEGAFSAE
jgi:hypothetical protein